MPQMYKVFMSDRPVSFIQTTGNSIIVEDHQLLIRFDHVGDIESIQSLIDKDHDIQSVKMLCTDVETSWKLFQSQFKVVEAAGGIVLNAKDEVLMIHRLGQWDLPKGKVDMGETIEQAATREVSEECGIEEPTIVSFFLTSYHTYFFKERWVLKPSHWYVMRVNKEEVLVPQTEENIDIVKWVPQSEIADYLPQAYASIRDVLTAFLDKN
jgi:8-oxo-dGTP pyrophosphatase MutT (NUDIX family)